MRSPIQLFSTIAILLATATVAAQVYKWVDKDGKVQYSDQAPPADSTKAEAKKVDTGSPVASTSPAPAKSLAERNKDFDKRQKDDADKAKKAEEARKKDEAAAEFCKAAQIALRELETGRPQRRVNEQGEVSVMSDEQREAELAKARAAATSSCKA